MLLVFIIKLYQVSMPYPAWRSISATLNINILALEVLKRLSGIDFIISLPSF